jgi:ATP-dependent Lon protease
MNMSDKNNISNLLGEVFYLEQGEDQRDFIAMISDDDDDVIRNTIIPESLPILPLRNTVLFPGVIIPITVGREKSLKLVREAYQKTRTIGAVAQKDPEIDNPAGGDLHQIGTIAHILKILEMPDGTTSVIIQGKKRFRIQEILEEDPYMRVSAIPLEEELPVKNDSAYQAIVGSLKDISLRIIKLSANIPAEASFAVKNIESSSFLINFICTNSNAELKEKQKLLEIDKLKKRATLLLEFLTKELQMLELKIDIQAKVKTELDQQQREFLLHQQMKTIQNELGGNPLDKEVEELKKKASSKKWSKDVKQVFTQELEKYQRLNPASAEYSVQLNYLHLMLDLPWNEYTKDDFDLPRAEKILDKDHFGMEEVKNRILEHLSVLKLKGDLKSPILCLYGPPGVGKTSLGKSIATALKRKYVRMSLGGLHDESEIRGHRRTYIGAMPGRIIQNLKKVKSSNPVFVLDEIDKVGRDVHGDPASALLEVLDPEQNNSFHDNYLDVDFDLSKVMFIATANTLNTIHPALRDRMETIHVSGYIVEEKIEIAKRHLVPKQLENHGLQKSQLVFSAKVLEHIIESYTRESGVRELDKKIARVIRRIARKIAFEESYRKNLSLADVRTILGPSEYNKDSYQGNEFAGVVTGLAWTAAGGEILFVETSLSRGEGKLTLTGNLGDVMKESALLALEYLKSHSGSLSLNPEIFSKWNVHLHVPEGAIPKDGPSAGITMVTSMASAFTQRKVKKGVAMTGEITLRGKVLPVGGIKEKIVAARRANLKEIILSDDNRKNVEEINEIYLKGLKFHYVSNIMEVLQLALLPEQVKNPLKLEV